MVEPHGAVLAGYGQIPELPVEGLVEVPGGQMPDAHPADESAHGFGREHGGNCQENDGSEYERLHRIVLDLSSPERPVRIHSVDFGLLMGLALNKPCNGVLSVMQWISACTFFSMEIIV
jgi:hypothetical protein